MHNFALIKRKLQGTSVCHRWEKARSWFIRTDTQERVDTAFVTQNDTYNILTSAHSIQNTLYKHYYVYTHTPSRVLKTFPQVLKLDTSDYVLKNAFPKF